MPRIYYKDIRRECAGTVAPAWQARPGIPGRVVSVGYDRLADDCLRNRKTELVRRMRLKLRVPR